MNWTFFQHSWFLYILAFIFGGFLGGLVVGLRERSIARREIEQLNNSFIRLDTEYANKLQQNQYLNQENIQIKEENQKIHIQLARLEENRIADADKLKWIDNARNQMRDAFESLASHCLKQNSDSFLQYTDEKVENLLKQFRGDWNTQKAEFINLVDPVKENLGLLENHIREIELKREGAYQGLKEELKNLSVSYLGLQTTTIKLTEALKSPTVRGRWGEIQLRRVVEMSGMTKHVLFNEQVSENMLRPDMIVYLPNSGILAIDSKVPLKFYLEALEAADEETRKQKYIEHVKAIRSRIRDLGSRKYEDQFLKSPEFVIMFVPNEACLSIAFEYDADLIEYALEYKVLLSTPMTLIGLLKAVVYGWEQHHINEQAKEIQKLGKDFFDRINILISHFSGLRNYIEKLIQSYNQTLGSLERRILPLSKKFDKINFDKSQLELTEILSNPIKMQAVINEEQNSE